MKKLLLVLAIAGSSYCGAEAQTLQSIINGLTQFNTSTQDNPEYSRINACGVSSNMVCKMGSDRKVSCYKTMYAENFKVCKGNSGYYICCEPPGAANSTHPSFVVVTPGLNDAYTPPSITAYQMPLNEAEAGSNTGSYSSAEVAPQSQSYPSPIEMMRESTYLGNYPSRNYIRVCYIGDNVAENNRNPYRGCPSPQDDGPEKNRQRNLNVSNAGANATAPPITGKSE